MTGQAGDVHHVTLATRDHVRQEGLDGPEVGQHIDLEGPDDPEGEVRVILLVLDYLASGVSSTVLPETIPALFTRMVTGPTCRGFCPFAFKIAVDALTKERPPLKMCLALDFVKIRGDGSMPCPKKIGAFFSC